MKEARFPWGFLFVHRSVSLVHHRARLTSYPGARGEIYIYIHILGFTILCKLLPLFEGSVYFSYRDWSLLCEIRVLRYPEKI